MAHVVTTMQPPRNHVFYLVGAPGGTLGTLHWDAATPGRGPDRARLQWTSLSKSPLQGRLDPTIACPRNSSPRTLRSRMGSSNTASEASTWNVSGILVPGLRERAAAAQDPAQLVQHGRPPRQPL